MGMVRTYWYFQNVASRYMRRTCGYQIRPEAVVNGIRCAVNSTTFAVFICGKSHKKYSSKTIPKYVNVRSVIFDNRG